MKPHTYAGSLPDFCATREGLRVEKTVLRPLPKEISENKDAAFSYQKLVPSSTGTKLKLEMYNPFELCLNLFN